MHVGWETAYIQKKIVNKIKKLGIHIFATCNTYINYERVYHQSIAYFLRNNWSHILINEVDFFVLTGRENIARHHHRPPYIYGLRSQSTIISQSAWHACLGDIDVSPSSLPFTSPHEIKITISLDLKNLQPQPQVMDIQPTKKEKKKITHYR